MKSVGVAGGDQDGVPDHGYLGKQHVAFLDIDTLFFELQRFKAERAWHNLNLSRDAIADLLTDQSWYRLLIPEAELAFDSFEKVRLWQEISTALLKNTASAITRFERRNGSCHISNTGIWMARTQISHPLMKNTRMATIGSS